MTAEPQQQVPSRVAVTAPPGSRLEELLASYEVAKAAAEAAAGRFKAVTDGIKAELASANPGVPDITLGGAPGMPRLRMTWKRPWRVDEKRLKAEDPALYVRYAVRGGHWEMRQL